MNKPHKHHLLIANTDLDMEIKTSTSNHYCYIISYISEKANSDIYLLLLLHDTNFKQIPIQTTDFTDKKVKFNAPLLLLFLILIFIIRKSKTIQVYEMNKSYIHHLLKANIYFDIKLKIFICSNCTHTTDFISKKAKFDFYLLLFPLVTNLIQLMLLSYNFTREKIKLDKVYKINKSYIYHLLKTNTNLDIKQKTSISNSCRCYNIIIMRPYSYRVACDFGIIFNCLHYLNSFYIFNLKFLCVLILLT